MAQCCEATTEGTQYPTGGRRGVKERLLQGPMLSTLWLGHCVPWGLQAPGEEVGDTESM